MSMRRKAWTRTFTFIGQGYYVGNEAGVLLVGIPLRELSRSVVALKITSRGAGWQGSTARSSIRPCMCRRNCLTSWLFESLCHHRLLDSDQQHRLQCEGA